MPAPPICPAGGAERQRHVDFAQRRRAQQLPGAPAVGQVLCSRAPCRRESAVGRAADAGTGQARRGAHEGHGDARHAVRGIRLQLHRPDRRPRPRRAARHPAQHQAAERPAVPARGHQKGQGLQAWPKPIPACITACRASTRTMASPRKPAANPPTPRYSATGCATWPPPTRGWSASRRRCAKAPAWCASPRNSRSAISTSASPSSTR